MLHPDGVEIVIKCINGSRGIYPEYLDPLTQAPLNSSETLERVIPVAHEEKFAVHIAFNDNFDFGTASHVQVSVDVDERVAEWSGVFSKDQIKQQSVKVIDKFRLAHDGFWRESAMTFEQLDEGEFVSYACINF